MGDSQQDDAGIQGFPPPSSEDKSSCRTAVLVLFPDMDLDYLTAACEKALWIPNQVIEAILNAQEQGDQYPKASKIKLKRKREDDDDDPAVNQPVKRWETEERKKQRKSPSYLKTCNEILQHNFPQLYVDDLRKFMDQKDRLFYPTYLSLARVMHAWENGRGDQPFKLKARAQKAHPFMTDDAIATYILGDIDPGEREALEELLAARATLSREASEAEELKRKEQEELQNLEIARVEGNVAECGCCFSEYAMNKMVHCDGDILHWFCRDCARMMAETQIGLAKYKLDCMSTDGCSGQFRLSQQEIFLDKNALTALSRIEQEATLREAGIENLETCPCCPFAMEYPPIEADKEFRCLNSDCGIVSCRACREETHIPKTCAEAAADRGHSARHTIEEAMSAALIRKCNKCRAPFIKENGCNKMTCTKCRNIQCYICSKSCDYTHFNDPNRGGKMGNCPLFDPQGIDAFHAEEVSNAEKKAREQVLQEHADVDSSLLEIKTSKRVKADEKSRGHPPPPPFRHQIALHLARMRAARDRVHNENGPGRLDPQQGRSVRAPILRGQKHLPPAPPQLGAGIVRGPGPGPGPGAVHSRRCNAVNPLPLNIQRMAALEQAQMPMPSQMGPFQHAGMIPFNMGGVQPQHLYQQQFNNNGGGVAAAGQYVNAIPGLWAPTAADLDALRRELLTQPGAAPPSAHPPHGPAQPAAMPGGLPQRQQQYQPRQDPVIQQQVGDFIHRANLPIGQLATLPDAPGQGNSDLGNQRDPWATALPDLKRFDMDVDVWKEMFGPDF